VRVAPVTRDTSRGMIAEIPELRMLSGFRNLPLGDLEALADAIRSMSLLANLRVVSDAEINPLIVKEQGHGVVAVDGLVAFE
jgi:succinyl-CoA synthetase beta subunit